MDLMSRVSGLRSLLGWGGFGRSKGNEPKRPDDFPMALLLAVGLEELF